MLKPKKSAFSIPSCWTAETVSSAICSMDSGRLVRGVHPKIVSEILGHSSVSITLDTYSHVIPGLGDAAARAMEDALKD
jgi:integrase